MSYISEQTYQILNLWKLENVQKHVLPETEQLLAQAVGKMNIEAAERRHGMIVRIINNLYMSCVKLGLTVEAQAIIHKQKSPMLEAHKKRMIIEGLNSR